MSPHKLALGITIGIAFGLVPLIGATTLLCFLVATPLRVNVAVTQIANYFVYPLQILLIIPLIQFGSHLLSIKPIPYSLVEMTNMINSDFSMALNKLWLASLAGLFAWAMLILPLSLGSYWAIKKLLNRVVTVN
jgi:uncharacterized protein (DUF2062 family)